MGGFELHIRAWWNWLLKTRIQNVRNLYRFDKNYFILWIFSILFANCNTILICISWS